MKIRSAKELRRRKKERKKIAEREKMQKMSAQRDPAFEVTLGGDESAGIDDDNDSAAAGKGRAKRKRQNEAVHDGDGHILFDDTAVSEKKKTTYSVFYDANRQYDDGGEVDEEDDWKRSMQ